MSKIEKTIARQRQKVEEGQFYEAHQQLRVIAARYIKQENYDAAAEILFGGAQLLLSAKQGGSGGDLCMYLLETYEKAELKPDGASRGRLLTLMRSFPEDEPTRKRFITEAIGWSAKFGEFPAGDPELHHVAGQLCAEGGEVYEAEKHLALGTKDSPPQLARLEYQWYTQDEHHTAGNYAARAVFPLLLAGNLRGANQAFLLFNNSLVQANPSLSVQDASGSKSDVRLYPSLPLLNFLTLLLLAIQKQSAATFRTLIAHYQPNIRELGTWDEALTQIGERYFNIARPRQSNPLMDMMSSMFGGSGGRGSKPGPQSRGLPSDATPALD